MGFISWQYLFLEFLGMDKFVLEYPLDWIESSDLINITFLNNVVSSLMEMGVVIKMFPVGYPSYGISRMGLDSVILSFHSYCNEEDTWSYKEAPIKGLFCIDPSGYGGWADIALNHDKYIKKINAVRNYEEILSKYSSQLKSGVSKYKQGALEKGIESDFILIALQVRTDSVADHAYLDIVDVLNYMSELALRKKKKLLIKLHPKCNSEVLKALVYKLCFSNEWVDVTNGDITQLIQLSNCVVACNSGVSLEALILNKKVYCFGSSEWFNITDQIKNISQLDKIFENDNKNFNLSVYQKKYIAFLLSEYWVRFDDKESIKNKLKILLLSIAQKKLICSSEEMNYLKILQAQEEYTVKMKRLSLIERDFETQNQLMKYFRKNPFFILIYFIKFNLVKLKSKIKFKL